MVSFVQLPVTLGRLGFLVREKIREPVSGRGTFSTGTLIIKIGLEFLGNTIVKVALANLRHLGDAGLLAKLRTRLLKPLSLP